MLIKPLSGSIRDMSTKCKDTFLWKKYVINPWKMEAHEKKEGKIMCFQQVKCDTSFWDTRKIKGFWKPHRRKETQA
jgi:hypothetical protein